MSVMLDGKLVFVINLIGFNWPQADEDKLRECARHWREYATELEHTIADSKRTLAQVRGENSGESIDALEKHWLEVGGHLRQAQDAAHLVAQGLDEFAVAVEALKVAVAIQLGILAGELAATTGGAILTFGLAELAAPAEIVGTQIIVRKLTGIAIHKVEQVVVQKFATAVAERFLSIKNGLKALKASRTVLNDFGKGLVKGGEKDLAHNAETRLPLPRATVGWTEDFDYRATFLAAHPGAGDVWVHHAVEQQLMTNYPQLFAKQEIHSLENLRGIPAGRINNQIHLSEIRTMWNDFYETNPSPSRADVLDFATKIDRKVGVFFSPGIS